MAPNASALNLEQTRRRKGISLEAIADMTKISSRFLRAIESEEFEKLPGGVFNVNYIKQYAAAIGFPEEKLLRHYQRKTQEASPEEVPPPVKRGWSVRSLLRIPTLVRS